MPRSKLRRSRLSARHYRSIFCDERSPAGAILRASIIERVYIIDHDRLFQPARFETSLIEWLHGMRKRSSAETVKW